MATPDINDFDPMYINQTINKGERTIVTSERWNELWNLIITQGDYNSEALDLVCDAIVALEAGQVVDNSITNAKLVTDIKIGSNALLDTDAKDEIVNAINELHTEVDALGSSTVVQDLADHEADTDVHLTKMTTEGDLVYKGATTPERLPKGTALQGLYQNAGLSAPEWGPTARSVMTAAGDILYASAANALARLAKGSAGQILKMGASIPEWANYLQTSYTSGQDTTSALTASTLFTKDISLGAITPKFCIVKVRGVNGYQPFNTYIVASGVQIGLVSSRSGATGGIGNSYVTYLTTQYIGAGSVTYELNFTSTNVSHGLPTFTINGTNLRFQFTPGSSTPGELRLYWEIVSFY